MTQRIRAENILSRLQFLNAQDIEELKNIAMQAQNAPPQGESDGSINERAWYALTDVINALSTIRFNITVFRENISR